MKNTQPLIDRMQKIIRRLREYGDLYEADIACWEYSLGIALATPEVSDQVYKDLEEKTGLMEREMDVELGREEMYG